MVENKVLKRQLKKLKITDLESLDEEKFNKLLDIIQLTYNDMDENLYRVERALEISTSELRDFSDNLELKIQEEVEKNREKERHLINQSRFASLGEMIGNIAHQWRQPLSAISSTASSSHLQLTLGIAANEDLEKSYSDIIGYTEFLSQTIDDFRNFLKSDTDRVEFCVNDVVNKTLKIVSSSYRDHDITISTFEEEDNKKYLSSGFPNKLSQVFLNIFNNAKDALISNKIEDKKIYVEYEENANYHIISIQDNAGGIPKNVIEKIFDPYFTTKHQSQGTGIGLYMSRTIVEDCGGEIKAQNIGFIHNGEKYDGARFSISLPKA